MNPDRDGPTFDDVAAACSRMDRLTPGELREEAEHHVERLWGLATDDRSRGHAVALFVIVAVLAGRLDPETFLP